MSKSGLRFVLCCFSALATLSSASAMAADYTSSDTQTAASPASNSDTTTTSPATTKAKKTKAKAKKAAPQPAPAVVDATPPVVPAPVVPALVSPTDPTPGAPKHYSIQSIVGNSVDAPAAGSFAAAILNGTPWIDARYRYEQDAQDGIHRRAKASTQRTRLGYQTASFNGFKAAFEIQNVTDIGADHYNSGTNGRTLYPTVSDPKKTAVRQAFVSYEGLYNSEIKGGTQLINLDNQRWIGQSDWRDLGNNFDAVSINNTYFGGTDLFYAHVFQANRGYGDVNPLGTLTGNINLINLTHQFIPEFKATAYTYMIDLNSQRSNLDLYSTATYGGRLTGAHKTTDDLTLSYALEEATQGSYRDNPHNGNNLYYLIEPAASAYGVTAKLGYEMMQGNGVTAIQTPLNTNHSFDGYADKFTTVPLNGLLNRYATLTYKLPVGNEWIKGTELTGTYRKFDSDFHEYNYGHEWDGLVSQTFFGHYNANLEVADYKASNTAYTDTYKIFAFLTIKY